MTSIETHKLEEYSDIDEIKAYKKATELKTSYTIVPNSIIKENRVSSSGTVYCSKKFLVQCHFCGEYYYVFRENIRKNQVHICQRPKKVKDVFLQKYGVMNPMQVEDFSEKQVIKRKETLIKKYGSYTTAPFMEKRAKTMMKRYGTTIPMRIPEIKAKRAKTNLERYGFTCSALNSEIKAKASNKYVFDNIRFDSSYELAVYYYYKKRGILLEREPKTDLYYINKDGKLRNYYPDFRDPRDGHYIEVKYSRYIKSESYKELITTKTELISDIDNSIDKYIKEAERDLGGRFWYKKYKIPSIKNRNKKNKENE